MRHEVDRCELWVFSLFLVQVIVDMLLRYRHPGRQVNGEAEKVTSTRAAFHPFTIPTVCGAKLLACASINSMIMHARCWLSVRLRSSYCTSRRTLNETAYSTGECTKKWQSLYTVSLFILWHTHCRVYVACIILLWSCNKKQSMLLSLAQDGGMTRWSCPRAQVQLLLTHDAAREWRASSQEPSDPPSL